MKRIFLFLAGMILIALIPMLIKQHKEYGNAIKQVRIYGEDMAAWRVNAPVNSAGFPVMCIDGFMYMNQRTVVPGYVGVLSSRPSVAKDSWSPMFGADGPRQCTPEEAAKTEAHRAAKPQRIGL